jgi:hypothetical protein
MKKCHRIGTSGHSDEDTLIFSEKGVLIDA